MGGGWAGKCGRRMIRWGVEGQPQKNGETDRHVSTLIEEEASKSQTNSKMKRLPPS